MNDTQSHVTLTATCLDTKSDAWAFATTDQHGTSECVICSELQLSQPRDWLALHVGSISQELTDVHIKHAGTAPGASLALAWLDERGQWTLTVQSAAGRMTTATFTAGSEDLSFDWGGGADNWPPTGIVAARTVEVRNCGTEAFAVNAAVREIPGTSLGCIRFRVAIRLPQQLGSELRIGLSTQEGSDPTFVVKNPPIEGPPPGCTSRDANR